MVFYFKSNIVSPPALIYMGKDKHENEELIRWGWPEDVWFHVHNYSSAHVYLRLQEGQTIDDIPQSVLNDAAQLVKYNSIQGNKINNVDVVYTLWSNLKKTADMEVGQIGFYCEKSVKKVRVEKRVNEIVNRLNKTKTEDHPDLRRQREERDSEERREKKHILKAQREKEEEEIMRQKREAEQSSYDKLFKPECMSSNYDDGNDSDDFM
ncbi:PREDICTED: coiled-coil domain-containing protein 25 [Bactrocera latifrons]|uniref:Coiled-coil domain-containing protein 25 n=2 Tax=Bactrocera latifrons TaxID=174628 RepID=A0A0K8VQH7_BACLA|nr:PREDICTED: coiled-coil domain-containing protein 25 [Bactrocera latifrons]